MKKKVLALLLGGVMAVGSLSMQVPVTVQADEEQEWLEEESHSSNSDATVTVQADEEPGWVLPDEACSYNSDAHIQSHEIAVVDGRIEVTLDLKFHANVDGNLIPVDLYFFDGPLKLKDGERLGLSGPYYDVDDRYVQRIIYYFDVTDEHFWRSFANPYDGTGANKNCYLYVKAHYHTGATYLGCANPMTGEVENASIPDPNLGSTTPGSTTPDSSSPGSTTPGNSSSGSVDSDSGRVKTGSELYREFESEVCSQIKAAESGSTFVMEKGITTMSNAMMKELLAKDDVSLKLEFTYNEQEYVIVIPAGAALDNDIPWYGPLYLAQQYGNSAGTGEV